MTLDVYMFKHKTFICPCVKRVLRMVDILEDVLIFKNFLANIYFGAAYVRY